MVVDEKGWFWDLEIDNTIVGKNRRNVIMTINDRESGFLIMRKLPSKEAEPLVLPLKPIRKELHTMTADKMGRSSPNTNRLPVLKIDIFFARPYHSWKREANENTNELVRHYFLKGTDFARITNKGINMVQEKLA